jgi:hypothetical protein
VADGLLHDGAEREDRLCEARNRTSGIRLLGLGSVEQTPPRFGFDGSLHRVNPVAPEALPVEVALVGVRTQHRLEAVLV